MGISQNQVLGRGKLYFEQYAPGTLVGMGERYLGNTTSFNLKNSVATIDEFDSMDETREKIESTIVQRDFAAAFAADDISSDNMAAWFGASTRSQTQAPTDNITETITVYKDRWFQLGKPTVRVLGLRNLVLISASLPRVNFQYERATGRVYVQPTAPDISDSGTSVTFTYDIGAQTTSMLVHRTQAIRGALRFVSENQLGNNTIWYFPLVSLKPDTDFLLKADTWQQLSFSLDVLKLNASTDRVYTDAEVISMSLTNDEEAALAYGSEDEIITWANELSQVIDVQFPNLNYP